MEESAADQMNIWINATNHLYNSTEQIKWEKENEITNAINKCISNTNTLMVMYNEHLDQNTFFELTECFQTKYNDESIHGFHTANAGTILCKIECLELGKVRFDHAWSFLSIKVIYPDIKSMELKRYSQVYNEDLKKEVTLINKDAMLFIFSAHCKGLEKIMIHERYIENYTHETLCKKLNNTHIGGEKEQ